MRTVLIALRQWGVVTGSVVAPTPADPEKLTPDKVKEQVAFMEISFRVSDYTVNVLGDTQTPKDAWRILEKRYGAK